MYNSSSAGSLLLCVCKHICCMDPCTSSLASVWHAVHMSSFGPWAPNVSWWALMEFNAILVLLYSTTAIMSLNRSCARSMPRGFSIDLMTRELNSSISSFVRGSWSRSQRTACANSGLPSIRFCSVNSMTVSTCSKLFDRDALGPVHDVVLYSKRMKWACIEVLLALVGVGKNLQRK